MGQAKVILHKANIDFEFENPVHAQQFHHDYQAKYQAHILRLIEARLQQYAGGQNITIELIDIELPAISNDNLSQKLISEIDKALLECFSNNTLHQASPLKNRVNKQTSIKQANKGQAIHNQEYASKKTMLVDRNVRADRAHRTAPLSFKVSLQLFLQHPNVALIQSQLRQSIETMTDYRQLNALITLVASQQVPAYTLHALAKLLGGLSAPVSGNILLQLVNNKALVSNDKMAKQLAKTIAEHVVKQLSNTQTKPKSTQTFIGENAFNTISQWFEQQSIDERQTLYGLILKRLYSKKVMQLELADLGPIFNKANKLLSLSYKQEKQSIDSNFVKRFNKGKATSFGKSLSKAKNTKQGADLSFDNQAYFEHIIARLLSPVPTTTEAQNLKQNITNDNLAELDEVSEEAFILLMQHAPRLLLEALSAPISSSELLRLCSRLSDYSLTELCFAFCAQYAISPPQAVLDLCATQFGLLKAIAWMNALQYLILEGEQLGLNQLEEEHTTNSEITLQRSMIDYVNSGISQVNRAESDTQNSSHVSIDNAKGASSNKALGRPPDNSSDSETQSTSKQAFLPATLNIESLLVYLQSPAIVTKAAKSDPHAVLMRFETIIRLPQSTVLNDAKAFGYAAACASIEILLNTYAILINQANDQGRYKSLPALKIAADHFIIAQAGLAKQHNTIVDKDLLNILRFSYYFDMLVQLVKSHSINLSQTYYFTPSKLAWCLIKQQETVQVKASNTFKQGAEQATSKRFDKLDKPVEAQAHTKSQAKERAPEQAQELSNEGLKQTLVNAKQTLHEDISQWLSISDLNAGIRKYLVNQHMSPKTLIEALISAKQFDRQTLVSVLIQDELAYTLANQLPATALYSCLTLLLPQHSAQSHALTTLLSVLLKRALPKVPATSLRACEWQTLLQIHIQQNVSYRAKWVSTVYFDYAARQCPAAYQALLKHHLSLVTALVKMGQLSHSDTSQVISIIVSLAQSHTLKKPQNEQLNDQRHTSENQALIELNSINSKPRELVDDEQISLGIKVSFAGLVLLHPYFTRLFDMFELTKNGMFIDEQSQLNARALLVYIATKELDWKCEQNAFINILCGLPADFPYHASASLNLDAQQISTIEMLLSSLIEHWKIGKTSIEGLQESFLTRQGSLRFSEEEHTYFLRVEFAAYDMLLHRLPWQISDIKLPWQPNLIKVDWSEHND